MSWQVAAFTLLALALAAGFAWYERSRPDARVVALVATLAALAALGRIAFAALPNVKPTTDIVLIAGYALGGAPGFVVGALTGLVSNFFFGQGPWTPWQMAGWGATGLIGAGLAMSFGRRRLGRWPLAIVCAIVGYAFTAFQDFGDWITYSDHSLVQLGVYVGRGTGFDLVHAASCLVFALAFGPALARSLRRFTARLEVIWQAPAAVPMALLAVALAALVSVPAARAATPASYLRAAQNSDGGLGPAPGEASSPLYAGWAALGLAADGINPASVSHGGPSLLAYVTAHPGGSDPGSLERTILAARAAGSGAAAWLGPLDRAFGRSGAISQQVNLTAFGVLALRADGASAPGTTVPWLLRQQDRDGGFSFSTAGGGSDVDDTAAALEALAAAGVRGSAAARAVGYIRSRQNRDGGFPTQGASDSNAQSTSWAVQGLIAAGVDPGSVHRARGANPLQYLSSLIAADGHVRYARGQDQTPVWVTAEAAMALAGKPLPLAPMHAPAVTRAPRRHAAVPGTSHHTSALTPAKAAARHARDAHRASARSANATLQALAGDAGVATALLLAPLESGQID
jgi:energy-coupling factor transport system substrate-specific component